LLLARGVSYDATVSIVSLAPSLAVLLWAAVAPAQPLAAGLLPSRRSDAPALRARVARLGGTLGAAPLSPPFSLAPIVARADGLSAAGRFDEAAALYDLAVEQGTRAPLDVADPPALLHAMVARASIGLARGEQTQAEALLARALRWDPTFSLLPEENTPRVRAAWARVVARAAMPPPLGDGDLGARCDRLLVARRIDEARVELIRIAGCLAVARTTTSDDLADGRVRAALGLPPLAPAITAAAPPPPPPRVPVYKRPWLWITVSVAAAAVAGGGVGIWAATRSSSSLWNVTPHF
jgi:hypothetical protein